jgi:predicted ester cyclase
MLEEFGVEVVFGLCGETSLPLYEALSDSHTISHVLTRDERSASFMADAYARLSGRVGVCEGPSGAGATYILPGVAEANDSSVPVVCVTTDISVADRGKGTLTELDQPALFAPITNQTFGAGDKRGARPLTGGAGTHGRRQTVRTRTSPMEGRVMKRENMTSVMALFFATAAMLWGCAQEPGVDAAVEQNKSMVQGYVDAANRGDATYLDEYFAPNYVYHGPRGDLDLEGFKRFHEMVLSAFPGGRMTAEDMIAVGDKVVTRWSFRGVQKGEFRGIAPTGNEVTVTGIIISRFEDGKAVEEWEEFNQVGMMQQLGVMPPTGETEK